MTQEEVDLIKVPGNCYNIHRGHRDKQHGPLAQLAEQLTLNQQVTGSIPVRLTLTIL